MVYRKSLVSFPHHLATVESSNLCIHLLFISSNTAGETCRLCRSFKALQREPFMAFIVATEEAIVGQDKPFVNPRGFLIAIEFVQGMNGFNPELSFFRWRSAELENSRVDSPGIGAANTRGMDCYL